MKMQDFFKIIPIIEKLLNITEIFYPKRENKFPFFLDKNISFLYNNIIEIGRDAPKLKPIRAGRGQKMKKLDVYNYKGKTETDDEAIMTCILKKIDMEKDEFNRVYTEGGQYIADVVIDIGNGTATRELKISELELVSAVLATTG